MGHPVAHLARVHANLQGVAIEERRILRLQWQAEQSSYCYRVADWSSPLPSRSKL